MDDGKSLQELQFKVATVTAELRERRELVTETADEFKVAKVKVVLRWRLRETAWEETDGKTVEIADLQE